MDNSIDKHEKTAEKCCFFSQNMREGCISHNEMKKNEVKSMEKKKLALQAKEIIKLAEESGVQSNYFFVTTFERYQVQLKILDDLKKAIEEEGMLVSKEYVKGRKNVYSNPAVSDYNRTTDSANKTVATLMRIIKNFGADGEKEDRDPLLEMIQGE